MRQGAFLNIRLNRNSLSHKTGPIDRQARAIIFWNLLNDLVDWD